ncbi:hypothetical protein VNO77_38927 [Canavalia gladiata]|uniref:Uncharacterized protein n=1 Tax=Canavalia gladiata TaxID=3824 RepID=A0AAN9KCP3_CANGL
MGRCECMANTAFMHALWGSYRGFRHCSHQENHHSQLSFEIKLYNILQGRIDIPRMKWRGADGNKDVLVLELLGLSLEDLFIGRNFSLKIVDQQIVCCSSYRVLQFLVIGGAQNPRSSSKTQFSKARTRGFNGSSSLCTGKLELSETGQVQNTHACNNVHQTTEGTDQRFSCMLGLVSLVLIRMLGKANMPKEHRLER